MPGMTATFILITFPALIELPAACPPAFISPPAVQPLDPVTMSLRASLALFASLSVLHGGRAPRPFSSEEPGCFKVNDCKCIMKDGSGVVNLKAMGDVDGFLGHLRPVGGENLLSFSPCQHFSQPEDFRGSDCTNVAVCLVVRSQGLGGYISRYISYGKHEGNVFHYNHSLQVLSVSYFAHSDQPETIVHYHCSPDQPVSSIRDQSLQADRPLQIWVDSPCACPNLCAMGDLGLGTIFLIGLSLSAAAYFVLGSCALRPFRSSSGVQMSPEHSVWCTICYLCSEGRPDQPTPRRPALTSGGLDRASARRATLT
ncbi:uncharacterized protein ACNS7B_011002 [Menidia menidia]